MAVFSERLTGVAYRLGWTLICRVPQAWAAWVFAKAAGIEVNVVREANDSYWSNIWLKKPFCLAGWGQRPTPDIIFTLGYAAGADWNDSHFTDDRFNELLVQARAELGGVALGVAVWAAVDQAKRTAGIAVSRSARRRQIVGLSATLAAALVAGINAHNE